MRKYKYLGILLGVIGCLLLWYSAGMNENLEGQSYTIEIDIIAHNEDNTKMSPVHMQPSIFYYDFENQIGNLSLVRADGARTLRVE